MPEPALLPERGVEGFLAGLRACGLQTQVQDQVITFHLDGLGDRFPDGAATGVGCNELQAWPAVPPHWVHLPADITPVRTNHNAEETLPGWLRHSRQIVGWGDAAEPAQAWLAHVRSVLVEEQ